MMKNQELYNEIFVKESGQYQFKSSDLKLSEEQVASIITDLNSNLDPNEATRDKLAQAVENFYDHSKDLQIAFNRRNIHRLFSQLYGTGFKTDYHGFFKSSEYTGRIFPININVIDLKAADEIVEFDLSMFKPTFILIQKPINDAGSLDEVEISLITTNIFNESIFNCVIDWLMHQPNFKQLPVGMLYADIKKTPYDAMQDYISETQKFTFDQFDKAVENTDISPEIYMCSVKIRYINKYFRNELSEERSDDIYIIGYQKQFDLIILGVKLDDGDKLKTILIGRDIFKNIQYRDVSSDRIIDYQGRTIAEN